MLIVLAQHIGASHWKGVVDCLTWYDNLMDILIYTKVGRDLYVRVDKVSLGTTLPLLILRN